MTSKIIVDVNLVTVDNLDKPRGVLVEHEKNS